MKGQKEAQGTQGDRVAIGTGTREAQDENQRKR